MKYKIYLSGPDRLLKNASEIFDNYSRLCEEYGFELIKMPEELFNHNSDYQTCLSLAKKRLELIKQADIIIADTMDFRSHVEPYSESAFELGAGFGLKKKLYCYMLDTRTCADRYVLEKKVNEQGVITDENGITFEPGPVNLMLEYSSTVIQGSFEDVLKQAKKDFYGG